MSIKRNLYTTLVYSQFSVQYYIYCMNGALLNLKWGTQFLSINSKGILEKNVQLTAYHKAFKVQLYAGNRYLF